MNAAATQKNKINTNTRSKCHNKIPSGFMESTANIHIVCICFWLARIRFRLKGGVKVEKQQENKSADTQNTCSSMISFEIAWHRLCECVCVCHERYLNTISYHSQIKVSYDKCSLSSVCMQTWAVVRTMSPPNRQYVVCVRLQYDTYVAVQWADLKNDPSHYSDRQRAYTSFLV